MSKTLSPAAGSPCALGYFMPAEWSPHAATWLSWPHKQESWPGQFGPIPGIWTQLAAALAPQEEVHVLASAGALEDARRRLTGVANVRFWDIPTDDAWIRDHGPTFLRGAPGAPPALVDWEYNAWGNKYPPFEQDNRVPALLAERLAMRRFAPGAILEGGAIDVNGRGSLLTSEQCLLNPNRNPGLERLDVEQLLLDNLSARHVIWLGEGIVGDDTDGHIDELARFVGERTVVAATEVDPADENYLPLKDNWRRLELAQDQDGRPLEIVPLPMPRPLFFGEQRLPAGYCNFYIANGIVVVPQFDDSADELARETLARVLPGRRICGIRAKELCWGLGAFHCITQQQTAQDDAASVA